jgi:hypothetical protein
MKSLTTEVLIVGSGAGGSSAFELFARNGIDVLMIEEGRKWNSLDFKASISHVTSEIYRGGGLNPIIGVPNFAFGEGVCLGGSTEVNGGLFWSLPEHKRVKWTRLPEIGKYFGADFDEEFSIISSRLGVKTETKSISANLDSKVMETAAIKLGWHTTDVPRVAPACQHSNRCGSGCPTGAKQSMTKTYIPDGITFGGRIETNLKIISIDYHNSIASSAVALNLLTHEKTTIYFKELVLSAGTFETAHLLRKNQISKTAGLSFRLHLNLKFLVKFQYPVNSKMGTIFNSQIQHFIERGILIMPTNFELPYVALSFAHLGANKLSSVRDNQGYYGLYTLQVDAATTGRIYSGLSIPIKQFKIIKQDLDLITRGIDLMIKLFSESEATEIALPFLSGEVLTKQNSFHFNKGRIEPKNLIISSVHSMASCPLGTDPNNSVVDSIGKVHGTRNVFVSDASILPDTTCESPQGTIMTLNRLIIKQRLNSG